MEEVMAEPIGQFVSQPLADGRQRHHRRDRPGDRRMLAKEMVEATERETAAEHDAYGEVAIGNRDHDAVYNP